MIVTLHYTTLQMLLWFIKNLLDHIMGDRSTGWVGLIFIPIGSKFGHCQIRHSFGKCVLRVFQWKFFLVSCIVYGAYQYIHSSIFSLKLGFMVLFIRLKIILLQCFQFSVISGIKTDPKCLYHKLKTKEEKKTLWISSCDEEESIKR